MNENKIDMITHKFIALGIFSSRWLQAPLYLGLIGAQGFYVYRFMQDVFHLFMHKGLACEEEVMLAVLSLIDMVMISNLLIMVIVGGYETFVSRLRLDDHPDIPEWLDHVNANTMKIKLSMALVGISSIHLLKTFIEVNKMSKHAIMWQVLIHITFLLSSLALAYTAKVTDALHRHGLQEKDS
ncbi:MAG: TIGR00645 family protein [Alphaproteobacteria bacterium CG_4_10_14_0_8_um_filter_37_21]|nr:MAG: TIGR00645 family protein [Alphaproteobacteria bacterium CG_4_10_14_0_8_um_filter_37_21]